jgi:hypothetical protein
MKASDVRAEAARLARVWADGREQCGDPEGAGEFRELAKAIGRIPVEDGPTRSGPDFLF